MLSEEGSCGFYECFEDRFPCDRAVPDSHQIQFELTHCLTMEAVAKQLNTSQVLPHSTEFKGKYSLLKFQDKNIIIYQCIANNNFNIISDI